MKPDPNMQPPQALDRHAWQPGYLVADSGALWRHPPSPQERQAVEEADAALRYAMEQKQ